MSFLSDRDILAEIDRGNIVCKPFERENLSNSSIDLRLGNEIQIARSTCSERSSGWFFLIDDAGKLTTEHQGIEFEYFDLLRSVNGFTLNPGDFVLVPTLEYVGPVAPHILGQISDKSTIARTGLSTFFGAGYIDPGNALNITLEIKNNGHVPVELQYGMHICQIRFAYLSSPAMHPYNGKYLNSRNVECAK